MTRAPSTKQTFRLFANMPQLFTCLMVIGLVGVVPVTAFAADTAAHGGSQYSPTFSPGYLIAWWICSSRKRKPIGGWLLYFYWQLYGGLLVSMALFAANLQSYVPENFTSTQTFALFLGSSVPGLLLLVIECSVATIMLSAQGWDMLNLLRWVMVAEVASSVVAGVIDAAYFPDNLPFTFLSLGSGALWLAYFYRSERVKHVFCTNDWDTFAPSLYPPKLTPTM